MGYVPPVKTYRIDVADGEHAGLSMTLSAVNVAAYLDLLDAETNTIAGSTAEMRAMLADFAANVIDWNLETKDGVPIPATLDGLRTLTFDFALVLCGHWLSAMGTVEPAPAPGAPLDGFDETDLPMTVLTPALIGD
jgi:hypothetical protein